MKTIKLTVLLVSLTLFSSHLHAQSSVSTSMPSQKQASAFDDLKINLTDSTFSATFRNKTLPVSNILELDNYLKTNGELTLQMKAVIETKFNVNPERYRSLLKVLDKNKIHSVQSFSRY